MYIWKENRNIHAPKKDGVLTVSITIQIIVRARIFVKRIEDNHPRNTYLLSSEEQRELLANKWLPKNRKDAKKKYERKKKVCICNNHNGL